MTNVEDPMAIEIAVTPEGQVSVNIQHLPMGADGWGHLTFDVTQAIEFLRVFQIATAQAHRIATGSREVLQ